MGAPQYLPFAHDIFESSLGPYLGDKVVRGQRNREITMLPFSHGINLGSENIFETKIELKNEFREKK